jgi:pimeloyl-ACP methyl ester carboxylesterase
MRRALRIAIVAIVVLVAVLIVNAIVLDSQTRSAEVNAAGGKLIEVNGVTLQYTDQAATKAGAEGEPIVLLHCYTCSGRWWDPIIPLLSEHHRVVTFDLLGHGGSEKPSSGYEIGSQSAAVAAAMNELGIRQATVIGHSMGGLVATSLAEQSSELVDRVVLIATPAEPGDADLPFLAKLSRAPVIGEAIWRVKLPGMVKSSYADAFAPGADVSEMFDNPDQVVDDLGDMTYKSYKESHTAADEFLDGGSVPSRLRTTGVPVLAIDGTEDQILDSGKVLADIQAIPGARIVPIEGAGHSPNVEKPEETAGAILPFVDAGGPVEPLPKPKPKPKAKAEPKREKPQGKRKGPKREPKREKGGKGGGR